METKKGTIRLVQNVNGKSNGRAWVRYEFEMTDGEKYATFDKDLFDKYGPGMSVIMSGHQDGKYWNLDNMILDDGTSQTTIPEAEKGSFSGISEVTEVTAHLMSQKDIMIISQCLTKCYATSQAGIKILDPRQVLDAYRFFVKELEENG